MNSKIILLSFAVIAVGLFALPSTMSLFAGQHTWYNVEDIPCKKCHQDIYDELTTQSAYHGKFESSYGNACGRCHVSTSAYNSTTGVATFNKSGTNMSKQQWIVYKSKSTAINSTGSGPMVVNFSAHAAITVECLACHGSGTDGQLVQGKNSPLRLMSDQEAHRPFYYGAVSNKAVGDVNYTSLLAAGIIYPGTPQWYDTSKPNQTVVQLKGTNAACIGCHTHAYVNISWNRAIGYGLSMTVTNAGWDVNFTGPLAETNTTHTSGGG
ncbi:MAG: hypothetical protein O8C61_12990 [Candidatus Methanoperedens sp.]|nr:hypothetical protein [Candidatus Methanoperedens sp.]